MIPRQVGEVRGSSIAHTDHYVGQTIVLCACLCVSFKIEATADLITVELAMAGGWQ